MNDKDKKEFSVLFSMMCEVFESDIDAGRLKLLRDVYFETLKKYPMPEVRSAMSTVMQTRVFNKLPKPAEILVTITGNEDDRAMIAFQSLVKGIKYVGPYSDVAFEDKAIMTTIQMLGGWQKLNEVTDKELKWMEKDFIAAYKVAAKRDEHPEKLAGLHSIQNAAAGYDITPLLGYVGSDPAKLPRLTVQERRKELPDATTTGTARVKELLGKAISGGGTAPDGIPEFEG